MSKAMNNGILPIGAVAVSKKIVEQFRKHKEFIFHLSTQNGNALCCAAAIAAINEIQKDNGALLDHAQEMGHYFYNKIENDFMEKYSRIFDIRRCGMMFEMCIRDRYMSKSWNYTQQNSTAVHKSLSSSIMNRVH